MFSADTISPSQGVAVVTYFMVVSFVIWSTVVFNCLEKLKHLCRRQNRIGSGFLSCVSSSGITI